MGGGKGWHVTEKRHKEMGKNVVDLFRQEMWWGVNDASLHKE